MKRAIKMVVSLILLLGLTGCVGVSNHREYMEGTIIPITTPAMPVSGDPITLIYNEVNPPDTIVGQLATEFKHLVELKSSGNITVDLYYSGELISNEPEAVEHMKAGDGIVDVSRVSTLGDIDVDNCGRTEILTLPFMFVSRDHFWAFAKSDLAVDFLAEASHSGVKALMFGEEGFRCFFSNKPINSAAEMHELKVRTYNKAVMGKFITGLRASVVDVNFSELTNAFEEGVIDCAEQPLTNYLSNKFFSVAPYLIRDNHTLGLFAIAISDSKWNSMTPSQKAIIESAINELADFNQEISESTEKSTIKQLEIEGGVIIELNDPAEWERAAFETINIHINGHIDDYKSITEMRPKEEK